MAHAVPVSGWQAGVVVAGALALGAFVGPVPARERPAPVHLGAADSLPRVVANDNRVSAGTSRNGVHEVRLVVDSARWYPEADDGAHAVAPAFAEEGGPPRIPAPLIRVRTGTQVSVTIRNALRDSTLHVFGLQARPAERLDTILVPPGEVRTVRFRAGAPGTYLYSATAGTVDAAVFEREQLAGALVVDPPAGSPPDRVFVINIWGEEHDSTGYRNAVAINGRSWPYTERIETQVGDSVRWRVLNASTRNHPMHLHGFYFRVDARGSLEADTVYPPQSRYLAVTEVMFPGTSLRLTWVPERPGNWLFHCHLAFHVVPTARLDPGGDRVHQAHDADPARHMAGLVLGIVTHPAPGWQEPERTGVRPLRLWVNEGKPRGRAERALGFVLQRDAAAPAPDSVEIPGSTLVLTRGEPTDITVLNRLGEATAVHWHGIELESYSDGVAGWSGMATRLAPVVAARDSFTARLTLPRAGTFIYHTHLNDVEQITSGLYGAIVVLEPGERLDPQRDHVLVLGWDGLDDRTRAPFLVNDGVPPQPIETSVGATHRIRIVNIAPAGMPLVELRRDTTLVSWRARAKDGADLPIAARYERPARLRPAVGETYDFEFTPRTSGEHALTVGPRANPFHTLRFQVR